MIVYISLVFKLVYYRIHVFDILVDVDAALDKNLDDMASGLARLKGKS